MAHKILNNTKYLIAITSGLVLLFGFVITPLILINIQEEEILGVRLLSFADIELPDTTCYIKTSGIAQKGSLQNTQQSAMLTKHPRTSWGEPLSLVDNQGVKDVITEFTLNTKTRCDTVEPVKGITPTFVIDAVNLKYEVLSQNKQLKKVSTYTKEVKNTNDTPLSDNKEATINTIKIAASDIEANLPEKEYNSYHEFRTSGKVILYYKGFPDTKYVIDIPAESIRVYYNTFITTFPESVPRPNTCPTGQQVIDGVCKDPNEGGGTEINCGEGYVLEGDVCREKPTGDNTPKIQNTDEIQKLLTEWFTKLLLGDFTVLSEPKYLGINALAGILFLIIIITLLRKKK